MDNRNGKNPFEIVEISPIYLTEEDARQKIAQLKAKLLEILTDEDG